MVLDTCALLWLVQRSPRLSATAGAKASVVWASAISAFEIALKAAAGKLTLLLPMRAWWREAIDQHELTVAEVAPEVGFKAVELPPLHRDPADRFIIATALIREVPVNTSDTRFQDYGVAVIS